VTLGLAFLLCRFLTQSKLGRLLLAIRDAESRVRFLGYSAAWRRSRAWAGTPIFA
jgi:urea transport system permease protein